MVNEMQSNVIQFPVKQQMPIGEKLIRESVFVESECAILKILESVERLAIFGLEKEALWLVNEIACVHNAFEKVRTGKYE